jgi:hypothetical protein
MMNRTTGIATAFLPRKSKLLVAALLAVTATLIVNTGTARAASEIGPSNPALVTCDSITNQIHVKAQFGAGDAYKRQWLAFRFYAKDNQTGSTFWLSPNGAWSMVQHVREGEGYYDVIGNWYPGMVTPIVPLDYQTFPVDRPSVRSTSLASFYVYAQYMWYSNTRGWLGPVTLTTASYSNPGLGWANPVCYL